MRGFLVVFALLALPAVVPARFSGPLLVIEFAILALVILGAAAGAVMQLMR